MMRNQAYMGDYTVLTELVHGPKIYVDTRELSMSGHIIMNGDWEQWMTKVFMECVRPGMTVCDLGANCGYYSLIASHLVGSTGKVHSFEPNPFHHENLLKSKLINGFYHMDIHPVAVADCDKEVTLFTPERLMASASLSELVVHDVSSVDQVQTIKVPAVNIESYLKNTKIDVFKVDIEGTEPYILSSLLNMMDRTEDPKMFLEFNPKTWAEQGFDSLHIMREVVERGYSIQIIQHDASLVQVTPEALLTSEKNHSHFDLLLSSSKQ